ncbi:hypothetical protein BWR60_03925 [Inquilinus limosus]|uniref:Uncharacterized protein n=2 Tax=Inquilinus limosus TaxID=171674 RepID=A0A211ZTF8_9PROT|nr:hypothetical protein BWR60_03925 [Inquilinus limosus]
MADADALAGWFEAIYDAILDPHRTEGASTLQGRSLQLLEIDRVLIELADETGGDGDRITAALRAVCQAVIAEYREIVPLPPAALSDPAAANAA